LAGDLTARGGQARYWRCDVSQGGEVSAMIEAATYVFGGLDILSTTPASLAPTSPPMS